MSKTTADKTTRASAQRPPALKDIAREVGCSLAAVSKVLNKSKGNTVVSQETRERIVEAARRMNYRPNHAAQALASRRARAIGAYVVPSPHGGLGNNLYEPGILGGVEKACRHYGYDLLLINLAGDQKLSECSRKFEEKRIDGIVLVRLRGQSQWLNELRETCDRIVVIDHSPLSEINTVEFDNVAAVEIALNHLWELGHRSIGFLGPCHENPMDDVLIRQRAFVDAMKRMNVTDPVVHDATCMDKLLPLEGDYCRQEGDAGAQYILSLGSRRPTAFIAYNDLVAASACQWLCQAGMDLPGEMSVVGIDNSFLCDYAIPQLTSVVHPLGEMGYAAGKVLIEQIEGQLPAGEPNKPIRKRFSPSLFVRSSTMALDDAQATGNK